jgi:hypothetical protein
MFLDIFSRPVFLPFVFDHEMQFPQFILIFLHVFLYFVESFFDNVLHEILQRRLNRLRVS